MAQHGSVLVPLVEGRQEVGVKPRILKQRSGFDIVVVDAELLVWVSDGEVEGKIVI